MTETAEQRGEVDAETASDLEGYQPPEPGQWVDYPLDELAIRDERRTAMDVVRRINKGRFVLDPDFQRGYVWKLDKQSRLIESVLMRFPLPVFYVAEDDEGRLVVVDGRQRLTTLQRFMENKFALQLPDRPEIDGKRFEDLDMRLQNRVEDCQLLFYIIDRSVPERARLDIFERVNGGEVLTRQQMRNAIYNGPATMFLREEAESDLFVEATGGSLNKAKMLDREFVNRFCSFATLDLGEYRGDMDAWLALSLRKLNKASEAEREALRARLRRTLRNNLHVFGKHAFRKHTSLDQTRSVINASLFDVMSVGLCDMNEKRVADRADALRAALWLRMKDETFIKAITYSPNTPKQVRGRFEIARAMFAEVFDAA
ncbi:MAG: DUF262 domain-containing protein [Nannocystaceae bacterium]